MVAGNVTMKKALSFYTCDALSLDHAAHDSERGLQPSNVEAIGAHEILQLSLDPSCHASARVGRRRRRNTYPGLYLPTVDICAAVEGSAASLRPTMELGGNTFAA